MLLGRRDFGAGGSACARRTQPGCTSTFPDQRGVCSSGQSQIIGGVAGAANAISSVIGTINTSFTRQGNAFVAGFPIPRRSDVRRYLGPYEAAA